MRSQGEGLRDGVGASGCPRVSFQKLATGVAAIDEIAQQGKNREVEHGIDADGDAEKPAERPGEGCVCRGHDEFGDFETWRKKDHQRDGKSGFACHGPGQHKKSHQQARYGGKYKAEKDALRHRQ
jgi:hypothetical protein